RVEMLNLEKDCVILRNEADEEGNWGDLIIKRGLSGGRANACSRSTKNQSRSSNISSPNPNVATSSANHVTLTGNSSPGYSNRKWDVSGKNLPVIRLRSIRTSHSAPHVSDRGGRAYGRFYAAVHRRARHHQDYDALCPPSGGVGQPGVRADQSEAEKEASGVGVADRSDRMKTVEELPEEYVAKSAY